MEFSDKIKICLYPILYLNSLDRLDAVGASHYTFLVLSYL